MARTQILEMLSFDNESIKSFIGSNGEIQTMAMLKPCFSAGPHTKRIPDEVVRQMVWNMINSLEELESVTSAKFTSIETIDSLSAATKDVPTRTISRHIVGGFDALRGHLNIKMR